MAHVNVNSEISSRLRTLFSMMFPSASLAQVARDLNVTSNTINNYVQHGRMPSAQFMLSLATRGADLTWLLTGEGTPLTDANPQREARTTQLLSQFSRPALMAEVDRRVQQTVKEGVDLLRAIDERQLAPLAKKLNATTGFPTLSDTEMALIVKVRRGFWLLSHVEYWYPDMYDEFFAPFCDLLKLHDKVTSGHNFRAIFYAETKNAVVRRGSLR